MLGGFNLYSVLKKKSVFLYTTVTMLSVSSLFSLATVGWVVVDPPDYSAGHLDVTGGSPDVTLVRRSYRLNQLQRCKKCGEIIKRGDAKNKIHGEKNSLYQVQRCRKYVETKKKNKLGRCVSRVSFEANTSTQLLLRGRWIDWLVSTGMLVSFWSGHAPSSLWSNVSKVKCQI